MGFRNLQEKLENNLFLFLKENPFRANQNKQQVLDSGFVKTCDEFVTGLSGKNGARSDRKVRQKTNLKFSIQLVR